MYKVAALIVLVIVLGLSVSRVEAAVERETFEV